MLVIKRMLRVLLKCFRRKRPNDDDGTAASECSLKESKEVDGECFDNPRQPTSLSYQMTQSERKKADEFIRQQRNLYVAKKKKEWEANPPAPGTLEHRIMERTLSFGCPYEGCSGGAVTYSFTPTTLGVAVVVRYALTNEELNVTDYDLW